MTVHEKAAVGFNRAGEDYQQGRPDYPAAGMDFVTGELGVGPGLRLLEVGAGTGKFTRLLHERGLQVTAVEPVDGMRERFRRELPDVPVLAGTAEALPEAAASVDAVAVAQAFHWFDGPRALAEFRRVLKPQGLLLLVWNVRDESVDWMARWNRIVEAHEQGTPRYRSGLWREVFAGECGFSSLNERVFPYMHAGAPEMLVRRTTSISFIAALPASERERVVRQVWDLIETHPQLQGKARIEIPYRTHFYWCRKNA